jgi:hypothetical protein
VVSRRQERWLAAVEERARRAAAAGELPHGLTLDELLTHVRWLAAHADDDGYVELPAGEP